jgi:NAD(P)H-quinone oxidoreductase subunit 4
MANPFPWLTTIILLPALASIAIPFLPDKDGKTIRWYALGVGILEFVLMCYVFWIHYDVSNASFQLVEKYAWLPTLGLSWAVSVDGLSVRNHAFYLCVLAGRS